MIVTQIKKDRMVANKEGNKQKYETLTTLLSEVQRLEKPDQEDDSKVQAVCKKYIKGLEEMLALSCGKTITVGTEEYNKTQALMFERDTVESYLPSQLSERVLNDTIKDIIKYNGYSSMKDMGHVMKILKEEFDGQYDGKLASQIVREFLK